MGKPTGEHWSLGQIRWWGGWSDGESKNVVIKYLLDEVDFGENDHSDAMAPVQEYCNESLNGE
ncbi:hypothetical protein BS47DRAFT_1279897, partial [Hydnum rufescens UP504]